MNAQIKFDLTTSTPHRVLPGQTGPDRLSTVDRLAAKSLWSEDSMAGEVDILLEDIRVALGNDLGTAIRAAGRLAALLTSKLSQGGPSAPAGGGLAPWQKRKIQSYIEDQLEEPILNKELARLVLLSVSHFSRAFKESFGQPVQAYIIRARVARARRLMMATPESLSQIALACGLCDQSHFCRTFRKATGVTPGAWRRSLEAGPQSATTVTDRNPGDGAA
jgi:AraC family transcriptional regulator